MKKINVNIDMSMLKVDRYYDNTRLKNDQYDKEWLLSFIEDDVEALNSYWSHMRGVISLVVDSPFSVNYRDNETITLITEAKDREGISNWDIKSSIQEALEECHLTTRIVAQLGKNAVVYISDINIEVEDEPEEVETKEVETE